MTPLNRAVYRQGKKEMYFLLNASSPDIMVLEWCKQLFCKDAPFIMDDIAKGIRAKAVKLKMYMKSGSRIHITDATETREYKFDGTEWMFMCAKSGTVKNVMELHET